MIYVVAKDVPRFILHTPYQNIFNCEMLCTYVKSWGQSQNVDTTNDKSVDITYTKLKYSSHKKFFISKKKIIKHL